MNKKVSDFSSYTLKEIHDLKLKKKVEIEEAKKRMKNNIQNILDPPHKIQDHKEVGLLSTITMGVAIVQEIWNGINYIQKIKKSIQRKH